MSRTAASVIRCCVALLLAVMAFTATGPQPPFLAALYLAAVTPWLVAIDMREHRLPNVLVLPGIAVGLVGCAIQWLASGRPPLVSLVGGVAYAAFLLVLHAVGGMGMGDVKLGAALGLASWEITIAVLSPVIAFMAGGLVALVLIAAGPRGRRIAFGPYLLCGYWVALALVAAARLTVLG